MAFTAVVDGNWSDAATWGGVAPSGNVSNQDIIIPSGIDVDLDIDVSFSGLLNNFTVDGTLTSSTGKQLSIQLGTFNGSGFRSPADYYLPVIGFRQFEPGRWFPDFKYRWKSKP